MATCHQCNRNLPPNGKCLFCGGDEHKGNTGESKRKSSSALSLWIGYLIKFGLAVGLLATAYWLIFTGNGQLFVEKVQKTLGMTKATRTMTPALEIMNKNPKLAERIADLSYKTQPEESLNNGTLVMVTFTKQTDAGDLFSATFKVELKTGRITPMDTAAGNWLK